MLKRKNIYLPNKVSLAYVCGGLMTWATLSSSTEANRLRLQLKLAPLFDRDYTQSKSEKQLNRDFVGPFLIQSIVIPHQNQGDWHLSCHFNPSTEVWGCEINNWPWCLSAAGNHIRGTVWGCCSGQGCLKLVCLKIVLLGSILLSWIWTETRKFNKICKQKCCRTTRSASTFFALLSGTVRMERQPQRAASSGLHGSTQAKINDLCLLWLIPAMFWYLWNSVINVCNQGFTNNDFIDMFTWMVSILFIIPFLTSVSSPSSHLLRHQKTAKYKIVCGTAEKLFHLDDEWTSSWLTIQCDKYALTFVQVKVVTESTTVYSCW